MSIVAEEARHSERVALVRRGLFRDLVQVLKTCRSRALRAARGPGAFDEAVESALRLTLCARKVGGLWESVSSTGRTQGGSDMMR